MPAEHTSIAFEPECAVLSAMSSPHAVLPPLGSNVAIVDAGGGTTDCIVSTLEKGPVLKEVSSFPSRSIRTHELELTRSAQVVPGFCTEVGGSAVDRAFEALLGGVFGRDRPAPANLWDRASASSIVEAMSQFENEAKSQVTTEGEPAVVSVAPLYLSLMQSAWMMRSERVTESRGGVCIPVVVQVASRPLRSTRLSPISTRAPPGLDCLRWRSTVATS